MGQKTICAFVVINVMRKATPIPLAKNLRCLMRSVSTEVLDFFHLNFPNHKPSVFGHCFRDLYCAYLGLILW